MAQQWQFWIDRGGTFTDIVAKGDDGSLFTHKLLSENPDHYQDAPIQSKGNIFNHVSLHLVLLEELHH